MELQTSFLNSSVLETLFRSCLNLSYLTRGTLNIFLTILVGRRALRFKSSQVYLPIGMTNARSTRFNLNLEGLCDKRFTCNMPFFLNQSIFGIVATCSKHCKMGPPSTRNASRCAICADVRNSDNIARTIPNSAYAFWGDRCVARASRLGRVTALATLSTRSPFKVKNSAGARGHCG